MNWKRMDEPTDSDKVVSNFDKMVRGYFKNKYSLQDFKLSVVVLVADVKMEHRYLVNEYLKVFRRIGKVKNFEVSKVEHMDKRIIPMTDEVYELFIEQRKVCKSLKNKACTNSYVEL